MVNVTVYVSGDVATALRQLKRALDRDGIWREMRTRQRYVKPSEKKKQKSKTAWQRAMRARRRQVAAEAGRSEVVSPSQRRGRRPA